MMSTPFSTAICLSITINASELNARELSCNLFAANDPTKMIEALSIEENESGSISIISQFDTFFSRTEPEEKDIGYSVTTSAKGIDPMSVIVVSIKNGSKVYPPEIWYVDWVSATVTMVYVSANSTIPSIYDRYVCTRVFE